MSSGLKVAALGNHLILLQVSLDFAADNAPQPPPARISCTSDAIAASKGTTATLAADTMSSIKVSRLIVAFKVQISALIQYINAVIGEARLTDSAPPISNIRYRIDLRFSYLVTGVDDLRCEVQNLCSKDLPAAAYQCVYVCVSIDTASAV